MPRTPKLPARFLRAKPAPASTTERRNQDHGRKPEEQPGLLWDKFRNSPAE